MDHIERIWHIEDKIRTKVIYMFMILAKLKVRKWDV